MGKTFLSSNLFPREFTFARGFLYALTLSINKFEIDTKDFLVAVSKFGLDSPYPIIKDKGLS